MCGHGTMGLVVTLAHLGRIGAGAHRIETPVGPVTASLDGASVTVENVPSHRLAADVLLDAGDRTVRGDIAWGGNWFFLCEDHGEEIEPGNIPRLTALAWRIRRALAGRDIYGDDGHEIDHVELTAPSRTPGVDARNFVLCPGGAYDRSPCGTGTSAKLACLAAAGKLRPGQVWRQESVIGSVFEGWIREERGRIIPTIAGTAYVDSEATLLLDPADPFALGIRR